MPNQCNKGYWLDISWLISKYCNAWYAHLNKSKERWNEASAKLDTTNHQHLTLQAPTIRHISFGRHTVRRVRQNANNPKITEEHLSLRHSLDLYNHGQVEKLVRKTAEKLEIGTSVIASALDQLTDELEKYRLAEIEKETREQDKRKFLTPEEIKAAKLYLSSPNLMERTREDIGRAGVIGEETNRLLMYLIFTSRKRDNPLHIISLGSFRSRKDPLARKSKASWYQMKIN